MTISFYLHILNTILSSGLQLIHKKSNIHSLPVNLLCFYFQFTFQLGILHSRIKNLAAEYQAQRIIFFRLQNYKEKQYHASFLALKNTEKCLF